MGRVLLWQSVFATGAALIAVLIGGIPSGIAAALAGLCCVIPNVCFFAGLFFAQKIFHKIILVFWFYRDVKWVTFIVSYILVLKSYIFLLLKMKS